MNVMKLAWEIARDGQKKFGGKVKEYFAESLKIAWEWKRRRQSVEARELALKNRYLTAEQAEKGAEMLNAIVRWAVENKLQASYWINLHLNSDGKLNMLAKIKADMDSEAAA